MPRTAESIVDNHREAQRRRNAGQPVWDHTVHIKHLLDIENPTDADARELGTKIASTLRATPWLRNDAANADRFGGDSEVTILAECFEETKDLADLADNLDRMYDLADADRTWIA